MKRLFIAQPSYGPIERGSYMAVDAIGDTIDPVVCRHSSSLLANGFNRMLAACLNMGGFDYWWLLHADVIPSSDAPEIMIAECERLGLDAIHAPCAIKDGRGLTSTAVAFSDDPWQVVRRITTTELHQLPDSFTINEICDWLPTAKALLPNTGCLMLRIGPWLDEFPGFEIRDRIVRHGGQWLPQVISEDWNFGYWAQAHGVRVGATRKVTTRHVGSVPFMTEVAWGTDHLDKQYFDARKAAYCSHNTFSGPP